MTMGVDSELKALQGPSLALGTGSPLGSHHWMSWLQLPPEQPP